MRPKFAVVCRQYYKPILTSLGLLLCLHSGVGAAAQISLDIAVPNRIGHANSVELFAGTVTNNTGGDINASDLFLDFSGFDPVVVSLDQLLGVPDFILGDGAVSATVDLFNFIIGPSAARGDTYYADVLVQYGVNPVINSDPVTVGVTIPEPSTYALLAIGVVGLMVWGRRAPLRQVQS